MAQLWWPWCSSGDDCCGGPTPGTATCFCCCRPDTDGSIDHCNPNPGYGYDVPDHGNGGPLQWLAHVPSTVPGSCFGQPCTPAGGDQYLDYSAGCTWISPRFSLCGVPGCFAWIFSIGFFPSCDANPVDQDAMRLVLANVCGGAELARWENQCESRVPPFPGPPNRCEPEVTLTCNGPNTLRGVTSVGLCWPCAPWPAPCGIPDIVVEPVWP